MKVLEKFLTMTVEEQREELKIKNEWYSPNEQMVVNDMVAYLNSEVHQDPLEKLGYTKKADRLWIAMCDECIEINRITKGIESYLTDDEGRKICVPLSTEEMKAILEIMGETV